MQRKAWAAECRERDVGVGDGERERRKEFVNGGIPLIVSGVHIKVED